MSDATSAAPIAEAVREALAPVKPDLRAEMHELVDVYNQTSAELNQYMRWHEELGQRISALRAKLGL